MKLIKLHEIPAWFILLGDNTYRDVASCWAFMIIDIPMYTDARHIAYTRYLYGEITQLNVYTFLLLGCVLFATVITRYLLEPFESGEPDRS